MSEWRRRAINDFPEFRTDIERAQSPHGVFIHLLPALQDAYNAKPWDESMIGRIYAYGSWMLAPERPKNIRGAALASFYEHLTDLGPAWKDLPHRATEGEIAIVREHLRGYLKPPSTSKQCSRSIGRSRTHAPFRAPYNWHLHLTSATFTEAIAFTPCRAGARQRAPVSSGAGRS